MAFVDSIMKRLGWTRISANQSTEIPQPRAFASGTNAPPFANHDVPAPPISFAPAPQAPPPALMPQPHSLPAPAIQQHDTAVNHPAPGIAPSDEDAEWVAAMARAKAIADESLLPSDKTVVQLNPLIQANAEPTRGFAETVEEDSTMDEAIRAVEDEAAEDDWDALMAAARARTEADPVAPAPLTPAPKQANDNSLQSELTANDDEDAEWRRLRAAVEQKDKEEKQRKARAIREIRRLRGTGPRRARRPGALRRLQPSS